jgi:hypothetical protein
MTPPTVLQGYEIPRRTVLQDDTYKTKRPSQIQNGTTT